MLVDRGFGADLLTMFTVDYEPGGAAQAHDHPFEETYFFLAGEVEAELDGQPYTLRAGDVVFAGVGSVHGFYNTGTGGCAGSRPRRPSRRRASLSLGRRRWEQLRGRGQRRDRGEHAGAVVVVGGTRAIGLEIARHYARTGREVVLTGRDPENVERRPRLAELGGGPCAASRSTSPSRSRSPPPWRASGPVRHLVLVAIDRDANTRRATTTSTRAIRLVTLKLVGYTEVVHALRDRLVDDASIVLFGGMAKERPYPGSTTVSTVNGGVVGLTRTLVEELKPIRVELDPPGRRRRQPVLGGEARGGRELHRRRRRPADWRRWPTSSMRPCSCSRTTPSTASTSSSTAAGTAAEPLAPLSPTC